MQYACSSKAAANSFSSSVMYIMSRYSSRKTLISMCMSAKSHTLIARVSSPVLVMCTLFLCILTSLCLFEMHICCFGRLHLRKHSLLINYVSKWNVHSSLIRAVTAWQWFFSSDESVAHNTHAWTFKGFSYNYECKIVKHIMHFNANDLWHRHRDVGRWGSCI